MRTGQAYSIIAPQYFTSLQQYGPQSPPEIEAVTSNGESRGTAPP